MCLGCSSFEYDPPPEPSFVQPKEGAYVAGEPLLVNFSEPIQAETLRVRLWRTQLTEEQELPEDATPVIEECDLARSPCGDLTIEPVAGEDGVEQVELALNPQGVGAPGIPLILEILPGVADEAGMELGRSVFYNVQFRDPGGRFNAEPVEFTNGTYIVSSIVSDPIPAVLTLISDIVVMPDGRFYLSGGEGDEINDAPRTTIDPEDLIVDPTEQGWAAHIEGFVKNTEDGRRILETDPVDLILPSRPIGARMKQVRLNAEIIKDDQGHDYIDGTLSFESVTAVFVSTGRESEFDGTSEALVGVYVPEGEAPEGYPRVCGDQCGVVVGRCDPPADFPAEDVCVDPEAEE